MNVFLSWSGEKSKSVALVLHKYLKSLINQVNPWVSTLGIETGARWGAEIARNLESANIGIICVTRDNQTAPWLLFEAGAIAKLTLVGRAMVLRIGIETSEVKSPLSQFQSVAPDEAGLRRLVSDINQAMQQPIDEATLNLSFSALWPLIESELKVIIDQPDATPAQEPTAENMLKELLGLARERETARVRNFDLKPRRSVLTLENNHGFSQAYYLRPTDPNQQELQLERERLDFHAFAEAEAKREALRDNPHRVAEDEVGEDGPYGGTRRIVD